MLSERVFRAGGTTGRAKPFMVLATQNPQEFFGTFPLPDARMDRFLMRYMQRRQSGWKRPWNSRRKAAPDGFLYHTAKHRIY